MYTKLKSELENAVNSLREGDGIIIKHSLEFVNSQGIERTVGYVRKVDSSHISLTRTRRRIDYGACAIDLMHFFGIKKYSYAHIDDILVVDRINH